MNNDEILLMKINADVAASSRRPPTALVYCDRDGKIHVVDYLASGVVFRNIVENNGDKIVARYPSHKHVISFGTVGGMQPDPDKERIRILEEMAEKGVDHVAFTKIAAAYQNFKGEPLLSSTSTPQRPSPMPPMTRFLIPGQK